MGITELLFGEKGQYDYGALCRPVMPWVKKEDRAPLKFYSRGES
jgi:hypothetical protein